MTLLAIVLIGIGCVVIGASMSARALAAEHASVERRRLLLDLERKEAARARDEYERLAFELRGSLHLEAPREQRVVIDLGAHRRGRGLVQ